MNKNKIIIVLFCIFLTFLLLLFSYKTVLFFTSLNLEQKETVQFIQGKETLTLNYTAKELSHLDDVKKVIKYTDYLFYFSLLFCTATITYYRKKRKFWKKLLLLGGITTVSVTGIILLFTLLSFNSAFTYFHQIFFPQGNWLFAADSLLIKTFPAKFFMGISKRIFLFTLLEGSILIFISLYHEHKHSRKKK